MAQQVSTDSTWYEQFFAGAALDLWRLANSAETTADEVDFLEDVLALPDGSRLLDVPCGNGRLSIPLAQLGYSVTGVDFCQEFISEARLAELSGPGKLEFVQSDMRRLNFREEFAGAYCMGNSFGYFDRSGTVEFLGAVAASLKSGAKFVLDSAMVAECFLVNGGEREWVQLADLYMLIENHYNCVSSTVETTYTFLRDGKEEKRQALHWIYTAGELCAMLEQAGFVVHDLFADTDAEPFVLGAERLLLVAQKN